MPSPAHLTVQAAPIGGGHWSGPTLAWEHHHFGLVAPPRKGMVYYPILLLS